jgi:hypothetical protein
MVNHNRWSDGSENDDDDTNDGVVVPPYQGAAFRPVLPPEHFKPVEKAAEKDKSDDDDQPVILYSRIPLSQLINSAEAAAAQTHEDDEDDEDEEDEDDDNRVVKNAEPHDEAQIPEAEIVKSDTPERPQAASAIEGDVLPDDTTQEVTYDHAADVVTETPQAAPIEQHLAADTEAGELPDAPRPAPEASDDYFEPGLHDILDRQQAPVSPHTEAFAETPLLPPTPTTETAPDDDLHTYTVPDLPVQSPAPAARQRYSNINGGYGEATPSSPVVSTYEAPVAEQIPYKARDSRLVPTVLFAMGVDFAARRKMRKANQKTFKDIAEQQEAVHTQVLGQQQEIQQQRTILHEQQEQFAEAQQVQQRQTAEIRQLQTQQTEQTAALPPLYAEQARVADVLTAPAVLPLTAEQSPAAYPTPSEALPVAPAEAPAQAVTLAAAEAAAHKTHEDQARRTAQEQQVEQEQRQQQQQEYVREVQDAWLRNRVDRKGQVVVDTETFRGRAFHDEIQAETGAAASHVADQDKHAAGAVAVSAGFAAAGDGLYAQTQQMAQQQSTSLPAGMLPPALPQGQPTHADPQHQLEAGERSNVKNPWFWLMLMLIAAAFFAAALL